MRRCHHCGYSRDGLPFAHSCPECGQPPPVETLRLTGWRHRKWYRVPLALFVLTIVTVGIGLSVAKALRTEGVPPTRNARFASEMAGFATIVIPLVGGLIAYRFRKGQREVWSVEGEALVISAVGEDGSHPKSDGAATQARIIERIPFNELAFLIVERGGTAAPLVGLTSQGHRVRRRTLLVDLPHATAVEILDRIAELRAPFERDARTTFGVPTYVRLVPNWYARGAQIVCPSCQVTRPGDRATHACVCGAPGWPSDWKVFPVTQVIRPLEGAPTPTSSLVTNGATRHVQTSISLSRMTLLAGALVIVFAVSFDPRSLLGILPIVVIAVVFLLSRPRGFAVVTPQGIVRIDTTGRWIVEAPLAVQHGWCHLTAASHTTSCTFLGRPAQLKALANAIASQAYGDATPSQLP